MEITIKTDKLPEMVTKSVKGASNNKLIPLTSLLGIRVVDGELVLTTTDATNYLYIKDKVGGEDFSVTVPVEIFSKLVSRMTCENIKLTVSDNSLTVTGNGTYTIELPMDEEGGLITYPDPLSKVTLGDKETINLSTISAILTTLKPALAVTIEDPCYTGYYIGDRVVATDTYKIASMQTKLFSLSKLLAPETMDLLAVMSTEKIDVAFQDNIIVFISPNCIVYGVVMENIDDYAIDAISELVDAKFESMCKVSKSSILQVLDRLSLFVSNFDKNGIYLTFTRNGINISSKSSSGVEIVPYSESKDFKDFTCCIDIEMLTTQIKAQATDMVEMYYGLDNAIKMVDGNIIQVVALLEDDRFSGE